MRTTRKRQRKNEEEEEEKEWFEVFKLILFHGFDTLSDISKFASVSKITYSWAQANVFHRGLLQVNTKYHNQVPIITHASCQIPSRALLNIRGEFLFSSFTFYKSFDFNELDQMTWTVMHNNCFFMTIHVGHYGIDETSNKFYYTTFAPYSYVTPNADIIYDNDQKITIIKILTKLL